MKSKPANGPALHNHNTNETFIPMRGRWRCVWEASPAHEELLDLGPYDTISFPPGVPRRFECLEAPAAYDEGLLLAVVGEDAPVSEAMPGVKDLLIKFNKGKIPTIVGHPDSPILMTTENGGFGG